MKDNFKKTSYEIQKVMNKLHSESLGEGIKYEHETFKKGCKLVGKLIKRIEKK